MKNNISQNAKGLITLFAFSALLYSCNKKDLIVRVDYPASTVGISQAAIATLGPGANGLYTITAKIEGQPYRYLVDLTGTKFNIPLGVIRAGVDLSGAVGINIASVSDTVTKMKTAGKLPAATEILPSTAYTLPASVNIEDNSSYAGFTMAVDLNFLIANLTKKYAIAVAISSGKAETINSKLSIAVIYIDPAQVLLPVANFSNDVDNLSKTANFINLSANGVGYSWNYGDGSPVETTVSPSHKYAAAGPYTIALSATGITGVPSVKTTTITIP